MGKKDGKMTSRKRKSAEAMDDEVSMDPELAAEMAAVAAIRRERKAAEMDTEDGEGDDSEKPSSNGKRARGSHNKEGLLQALSTIKTNDLPFIETFEICETPVEVTNVLDDIEREMAFYNHSLAAATTAVTQLKSLKISTRRPEDYFAESVKSDAHMAKVKEKILLEKKKIEAFEKRKENQTSKKQNKQLQELKKQQRAKATKSAISEVDSIRKRGDSDGKLDKIISGRGVGDRNRGEKSFKRKGLDKKYGGGVKEKMRQKLGTKKSLNDLSDYSPRGGKAIQNSQRGRSKSLGKNKGAGRPGKSKRDAKRSK